MKTKKKKYVATNLRTKENQILSELIDRVLERYSVEEITIAFLDKITDWHDREVLVKELLKDSNVKDDLTYELKNEFTKDKFVVKLETEEQEIKLNDFICQYIYPYYNEQQANLFA